MEFMINTRRRIFWFAFPVNPVGAALKKSLLSAPTYQKNVSGAALKLAAPAPQH